MTSIDPRTSSSALSFLSRTGGKPPTPPPGATKELDSALQTARLSDEDQASFKSDLEQVFSSAFESGSFDSESIQNDVKAVFEKYDVDESALKSRFGGPPPGGPPSGFSVSGLGQSTSTNATDDSTKTLLDLLKKVTDKQHSSESSTSNSSQLVDELLSQVLGFDKTA